VARGSVVPEAGVYRGLEAVEAYNRQFLAEFAELHYEPQELIDANDHVIANMHIHGRGRRGGPRSTSWHGGCAARSRRSGRARWLAVAIACAVFAVAGAATQAAAQTTTSPLRYVALGDSYSAASGVVPRTPRRRLSVCARSSITRT